MQVGNRFEGRCRAGLIGAPGRSHQVEQPKLKLASSAHRLDLRDGRLDVAVRQVDRCNVQRCQPELTLAANAEAVAIFGCLSRDRVAPSDVQSSERVENFGSRGQVRVVAPNRNEASVLLGDRVEVCARFASPRRDSVVATLVERVPSQAFEHEVGGENVSLVT
jgi:hypothetical protein